MGGGEHAAAGVYILTEVLGTDEGMLTAKPGDLGAEEFAIEPVGTRDLLAVDNEEAAEAITFFKLKGEALLAVEECIAGPGGAGEDAGGIAGGSHGREAFVVDAHLNVLGFIDDEETAGGGADDAGGGIGGEVGDAGGEELKDITMAAVKASEPEEGALRGTRLKTIHGVDGLRLESGLRTDDGCCPAPQSEPGGTG